MGHKWEGATQPTMQRDVIDVFINRKHPFVAPPTACLLKSTVSKKTQLVTFWIHMQVSL